MRISPDIIVLLVTIVTPHLSDGEVMSDSQANRLQAARGRSRRSSADALTEREKNELLQCHNHFRGEDGLPSIGWDGELEEWAKWVISCNANYPVSQHSFTNFYRFGSEMSVKDVVSAWRQEGRQPFLERGCRTPLDRTRCNRNTNMMQPRLTSMACAALQCSSMRQLVCIYNNKADRENHKLISDGF